MRTLRVGPADAKLGALVVHGNDLCPEFYVPLADALATFGVRSVLVALPGFSGEPPLPGAPSWHAYAERLAATLDGELPAGGLLVGHSMGGLLAFLSAATCRPRALRGLVLMEPPIFPTRRLAAAAAARYNREVVFARRDEFRNWSGTTWRVFRQHAFPSAALELYLEARRRSDPAHAAAMLEALPALYPLPYARVRVPTLLLRGEHSGWRMKLIVGLLRARLPRVTARTIPGCAHFMANEADAAIARVVATFATGLPG